MNKFLLVILWALLFFLYYLIDDYVCDFLKSMQKNNRRLKFIINCGVILVYYVSVAFLVISIAKILNMSGWTLLACEILGGLIFIALLFTIYFVNRKKRGKHDK